CNAAFADQFAVKVARVGIFGAPDPGRFDEQRSQLTLANRTKLASRSFCPAVSNYGSQAKITAHLIAAIESLRSIQFQIKSGGHHVSNAGHALDGPHCASVLRLAT